MKRNQFFISFFVQGQAQPQKSKKAPKPAPVEESSEEDSDDDDDDDDVEVSFDSLDQFCLFIFKKYIYIYAHLLKCVFFLDGTGKWKGLTSEKKGCRS